MLDSKINQYLNRQIVSPQFRGRQNVSKPEIKKNEGLTTGAKWAIGLGLTALTSYAIYGITKGRVKPKNNPTPTNPATATTIRNLEEMYVRIKNSYDIKKLEGSYDEDLLKTIDKFGLLGEKSRSIHYTRLGETINDVSNIFLLEKLKKLKNISTPELLISEYDKIIASINDIPDEIFKFIDDLPPEDFNSFFGKNIDDLAKRKKLVFTSDMKASQKIKQLYIKEIKNKLEDSIYSDRIKYMKECYLNNDTTYLEYHFEALKKYFEEHIIDIEKLERLIRECYGKK